MRKIKIISTLAMLFIGITATAQEEITPKGEDKAIHVTKKLDMKLDLSEEQEIKVQNSLSDFFVKVMELKSDKTLEKEVRVSEIKALKEEQKGEMKSILSKEQYETFLKMEAEREAKMEEKRAYSEMSPEERVEAHLKKINDIVELSDDQEAELSIELMKLENKIAEARAEGEMKKEEIKNKMKEHKQEFRERMSDILTPEQMQKLKDAKKARHS